MKTFYLTWGGRLVVHSLLHLFLMNGKILFDVVNTLMFILFAFMIYKYAMRKGVSNSLMLGIYLLLWISIPGVGETIVLKTQSCNYLWGTTILLMFFYPFFRNVKREWDWYHIAGIPVKGLYAGFMTLFGVLAGCTIEAGGAMLLFAIGCIGLFKIIKKKRISLWEITGFAGACVGYAVLILAPGNYVRASSVVKRSNIVIELLYRLARETYYMLLDMWWLFAVFFILLFVLYKTEKTNLSVSRNTQPIHSPDKNSKQMLSVNKSKNQMIKEWIGNNAIELFFLLSALVGVYVMTLTAAYAERVLTSPIAFLVIAIGLLYRRLDYEKYKGLIWICLFFLGVYVAMQATVGMYQLIFSEGVSSLNIRTIFVN